jgi:hypothetical protein
VIWQAPAGQPALLEVGLRRTAHESNAVIYMIVKHTIYASVLRQETSAERLRSDAQGTITQASAGAENTVPATTLLHGGVHF